MGNLFGQLFVIILVFTGGFGALLFSVLAWRLKNDVHFYIGLSLTAVLVIYAGINYAYVFNLMFSNVILFAIHMVFIAVPIYFLIQAKKNSTNDSFDEIEASGDVSEAYLDQIINAPDEEIDYEEDLDLE